MEDEDHVWSLLRIKLESRGMEVIRGKDGLEGLKIARSENPDLILLDILLPGIDGYRVCKLLKFDEKSKHIPILIVSAKGSDQDKKIGFEAGCDGYISKPFKLGDLLSEMNQLFGE